jgi:hypothetical protein
MAGFASRLIAELIGEFFVDAVDRHRRESVERFRQAWFWFREIAEPPPGTELLVPDGSVFTGVLIIERNQAVFLVALHHRSRGPQGPGGQHWSTRERHQSLFEQNELELDGRNPLYGR